MPKENWWSKDFEEMLGHYKQVSETKSQNTALNNVRRKPNTELEKEIVWFISHVEEQTLKRAVSETGNQI